MTSFPIDAVIFNKIVEVFNETRQYVLLLFPLAFFVRIAFGFIFLKTESFIDILKDSLFLFLGLFFFTDILKMTLQIPYFVSSELSTGDFKNINLSSGIFTKTLKRFVEWIGIISYWISFGLYVVIVSILGFFAGYILFFGTMFRLYGLIKIFFILLFTVSLWPFIWHSINFAVLTIAVSDNAFANNVIVGGSSLAKLFIPIWLISKSSKIPFGKTLKKFSLTGGSVAVAGSSYASSFFSNKNSQNFKNEEENSNETNQETNNKLAEINFSKTELETNHPFKSDEQYIDKLIDDISIREKEHNFEKNLSANESLKIETAQKEEIKNQFENQLETQDENNIKQESFLKTEVTNEITKDVKNLEPLNETNHFQGLKNQNSTILNKSKDSNLKEDVSNNENESLFNEAIHQETWSEDNANRSFLDDKNKKGDVEL